MTKLVIRLLCKPYEAALLILHVSGIKRHLRTRITVRTDFVSRPCLSHPLDLALLCKYQHQASCLLCFCKASATLLTFIYICCQRITFLSYERLSRPACLNVVTHKFIIRTLGTRLKGPICDPNVNKRAALRFKTQDWNLLPNRLTTTILMLLKDQFTKTTKNIFSHLPLGVILAPNKWTHSCLSS